MGYVNFDNQQHRVSILVSTRDRIIRKEHLRIALATVFTVLYVMASMVLAGTNKPLNILDFRMPVGFDLSEQQGLKVRPSKGKFLVASRQLLDPQFSKTVILLLEYHRQGAMGLIINRPTELKLFKVLPEIEQLEQLPDSVYLGGPVAKNQLLLLIRTANPPAEAHHIFKDIYVSSSQEVIQHMIETPGSGQRFRVYAGYAGWGPGQLDREIWRGGWHVLQADVETVFDKSASEIWPALIHRSSAQWVGTFEN